MTNFIRPMGVRSLARASDPETSRKAAASTKRKLTAQLVLQAFCELDPMARVTDDQLQRHVRRVAYLAGQLVTDSGVRTRRSELVSLGLVAEVALTRNERGRSVRVFAATPLGRQVFADGVSLTEEAIAAYVSPSLEL